MERTKTSGIYSEGGCRIIDRWFKGERIYRRLGNASQEEAEAWLAKRINEIRAAKLFGEGPRRTFREAAVKHYHEEEKRLTGKFGLTSSGVLQRKGQDQLNNTAWHLKMLDGFIGDTLLDEVCDDTLKPFVEQREQDGVAPKTIAL